MSGDPASQPSEAPDSFLPDGKSCADCAHLDQSCRWLLAGWFACRPPETVHVCDWVPSRFREKGDG